jgi:uncharacterized membrane protein required for colicin V production
VLLLDFAVLLLLIFSGYSGYRNGAFVQVFSTILLIVSFFLARVVNGLFDGLIGAWLSVDPRYAGFLAFLITWGFVYLLLRLLTLGLVRSWKSARSESGGVDRILGAALGTVKGFIGLYFLLSVLVLANKAVARAAPSLWVHYQESYVGDFVERHNLFEHLPDRRMQALVTLVRLASDPDPKKLNSDPSALLAFQELNTQVLSDHPKLRQSLLKGDFASVATDEGVIKLLNDPAFIKLLDAMDAARTDAE